MAWQAIALAAAAFLGGTSAFNKSNAEANTLQAQAAQLRMQADITRRIGAFEIRQFRRSAQYRMGAITAGQAAGGVDIHSGSAMDVRLAQARGDASAELQIQNARALQAWGMEQNAVQLDYNKKIVEQQRPFDVLGGALSASTPFIGGL